MTAPNELLRPHLEAVPPDFRGRVAMTVSCHDCDRIEKVPDAGQFQERDGRRVQVMHNGLLVEAGGYYGDWMAEIIRCLRGHHEPQEEAVFDAILKQLQRDADSPIMIEFGSFWTYYGLWFCRVFPNGRVIALEPDPAYIEVGKRNAKLNDVADRVTFIQGAIGNEPGHTMMFRAESDGTDHEVVQYDLASLMNTAGVTSTDLVLADVQGAETLLLERAQVEMQARRVRFMMVSTHHHSISGDPLTHQRALALLTQAGGRVIAEHTVSESYSGDGLIAVSFDQRDQDLSVPLSRARAKDSLFGELEVDIVTAEHARKEAEERAATAEARQGELVAEMSSELDALRDEIQTLRAERDHFRSEIANMTNTKLWRWSTRPRQLYSRLLQRYH